VSPLLAFLQLKVYVCKHILVAMDSCCVVEDCWIRGDQKPAWLTADAAQQLSFTGDSVEWVGGL